MTAFTNTQEVDTFLRERNALRAGGNAAVFLRVNTDSRKVEKGDLFVALKGDAFDGHAYVQQAKAAGATGAVVSREWAREQDRAALASDGFALWMVDDTLTALGDLARGHLRRLSCLRGALTGSNGKTTTKEFTAAILKAHYGDGKVLYTQGNLNNQVGVPLTAFGAGGGHAVALFEMGMNHPGEIAALCRIVDPVASLITNVGPAHIGNFDGKIDGIAAAKGEIFHGTAPGGTLVVNADDERVAAQAAAVAGRKPLTFGRAAFADWRILREEARGEAQRLVLAHDGKTLEVNLAVPGGHNALNAVGAAALAAQLGAGDDAVVRGLEGARTVSGRLTQRKAHCGALVIDDSYNANPGSMKASMDVARALAGDGRLVLVLGDMLELGARELEFHREVGRAAAAARPSLLVVAGARSRSTAEGAREAGLAAASVMHSERLEDLLPELVRAVTPRDVVLVKGSRGARMERAVAALCGSTDVAGH
ncbi:MAG: UDP-N-acetylmuramoyl-tripeptide--D-alanyl-D-alanine ligase [Deltaproteobacteria bacterium]|nr:UDP-N-acetylmuramoyl-tripeptide--D-alanyl-D-alanine ligase [Deltaproteobacteria bacterium]